MKDSMTIRIFFIFLILFLIVYPVALQADEGYSSIQEIVPGELIEAPMKMTQEEMNDLFGEDPYLGQTSYLQSPDGFRQREKSN